jgi:hypothetical protein
MTNKANSLAERDVSDDSSDEEVYLSDQDDIVSEEHARDELKESPKTDSDSSFDQDIELEDLEIPELDEDNFFTNDLDLASLDTDKNTSFSAPYLNFEDIQMRNSQDYQDKWV